MLAKKIKSPLFAVGTALLMSMFVVACGGSPSSGNQSSTGGNNAVAATQTLVVANEDGLNTLDPAGGQGTHTVRTLGNFYESLVRQVGNSPDIKPDLATSWSASSDGLVYTFHLRHNVKFQDGTPFNAEAVKFTFDRALDPKDKYYYGPYAFPSFFQPNIKSIKVVDPYTVQFILKQVDPTFIPNLLWSTFGIVSPTAVEKYGKNFPLHGAGTGPYEITQWDKGSKLVAKAFKGYWGGAPKINTLIFKPVQEDAARLTQLQSGDINVAAAISPQLIPSIQAQPSLKVEESSGIHTWFVLLNTATGPLKDVRVRQALNYAVDRQTIVKDLLHDTAVASTSFGYPGTPSYNPKSEMYNYDPNKAKQLLAEAGYANGLTLKFIVPSSGSGMVAPVQLANVIQSDLAKVGVKVEITTEDWNTYLASIEGGLTQKGATYDMAEMSWMSTAADPGLYVNYYLESNSTVGHSNGFNIGYYSDPKVDALLKDASSTTDETRRNNDFKQAEVLVAKDAPWLFMFHSKNVIAMAKNVQGVQPNPNMNYLWLGGASIGQ